MDIKNFAAKPQLVEVVIDDEHIVSEYGETITFWMKDQVDINTYFELFKTQSDESGQGLQTVLSKIILNKEGKPVLGEEETFPVDITIAALTRINQILGKSKARSSIPETGTSQE
jgi:hypothetical protein